MEPIKQKKFKIFVVFHDKLNPDFYHKSLMEHYIFINVNKNNPHNYEDLGYNVINLFELENFIPLGKWYTESEVIYNIYKNNYLNETLDYIGFSQYDIDTTSLNINLINELVNKYNHINFQPISFEQDYSQNILMDENKPNKLRGSGKNVYNGILDKYNTYYNKEVDLADLKQKKLNLCSSFLIKKDLFIEMMNFTSKIIESKELDNFDVERKYRIQGGFLERFYAVWLGLKNTDNYCLPLTHFFEETKKQNKSSIFKRILKKLSK